MNGAARTPHPLRSFSGRVHHQGILDILSAAGPPAPGPDFLARTASNAEFVRRAVIDFDNCRHASGEATPASVTSGDPR